MKIITLWPSFLLVIPLAAQGTIVSPGQFASAEGNTSAAIPFLAPAPTYSRYMQIHSDLGTTFQLIKQLAFRLEGATAATTSATLTIDLEVSMAPSVDFDKASWVFANNATGTAINVIPRRVLNIGPITGTATTPEPFAIKLPFLAPYPYLGNSSVLWEAKIFSNNVTAAGNPVLDMGSNAIGFALSPTVVGTGCQVTGQSSAMKLTYQQWTSVAYYTFSAWVDFAPANAATVFAIGVNNPATVVPGLCGALYTDLLVILPMGVTNANGFLGQTITNGSTVTKAGGGAFAFVVPNTWGNTLLYYQAHSIDSTSTSLLPIANSNGIKATAVGALTGTPVRVTRLYSADGGTTQQNAYFVTNGALTGLVTEFSY